MKIRKLAKEDESFLWEMMAECAGLYSSLSLSVSIDNPAARLYERLGFLTAATDGASQTMVKPLV